MTPHAARGQETAEQAVREANHRFYRAFASLDIEQMAEVWLQEDWVECVHPGWDLLLGWDEVRESWTGIFSHTQRVRVELSSEWVRVEGDVAWIACTEHLTSTFETGFDQSLLQATNIFVRRARSPDKSGRGGGDRWLMVAHHASPLPAGRPVALQ